VDKSLFLNKRCKVHYITGFILEGIVKDIDDNGFIFETNQSTSFISWHSVRDVQAME